MVKYFDKLEEAEVSTSQSVSFSNELIVETLADMIEQVGKSTESERR